jgi:hypothetical protein
MQHEMVRGACVVCHGETHDESLTTHCCGRRLAEMEAAEVRRGRWDYCDARGWIEPYLDSSSDSATLR